MEGHVGGAHARPVLAVAAGDGVVHGLAHALVRRVVRVRLRQRLAFDHAPHAVEVDDGGHAGHRHRDAAVGRVGQQTFLGQVAERFAQRIARYIEALRQRRFGQALAGREFAVDQPAADLFGDFVGQGLVRVGIGH
ncbi:hypothetical protein D3C71_1503380 [compost metagenome]